MDFILLIVSVVPYMRAIVTAVSDRIGNISKCLGALCH